jgi:hypothetical protein
VQGFIRGEILSLPSGHSERNAMKKYEKKTRKENEFLRGKGKHTKHTWVCHKTKGLHSFELDFPPYAETYRVGQYKEYFKDVQNPKDWYAAYDKWCAMMNAKEKEKGSHYKWGMTWRSRYYKCELCGKQAFDDANKPDKRIQAGLKVEK